MTGLAPLDVLYELEQERIVSLPSRLNSLYGRLRFPAHHAKPYVIANFVSTLDGVTTLSVPGQATGGHISGFNPYDRMVMGVLRAVADAVVVGAGTARSVPEHLWTAEHIFPSLSAEFRELRASLNKNDQPLNVLVSATGNLDPDQRVLRTGEAPVLVVTTENGARRLRERSLRPEAPVQALAGEGRLRAEQVLEAVSAFQSSDIVLLEGGPHLMGDFFGERLLDELFLTLSPQVAGRDGTGRPGFIAGKALAPGNPVWGKLVSVRRAQDHLFLRHSFPRG